MYLLTILMLIETITGGLSKVHYLWPEFNDQFDCIVGIAIDDNPVGVGVFVSTRHVLTTANPLNILKDHSGRIRIHVVKGYYNASKALKVQEMSTYQVKRKQKWIPMGIEGTEHTSIHDITILRISKSDQILKIPRKKLLRSKKDKGRRPYPLSLSNSTAYQLPMELLFSGFGYLDQEHVQNNSFLEVSYTSESVADCDEWIPREWGRFICILDEQNSYSLSSGAPLMDEDMSTVYGLGCFSLKKGKDNLFIFTDFKAYLKDINANIGGTMNKDE